MEIDDLTATRRSIVHEYDFSMADEYSNCVRSVANFGGVPRGEIRHVEGMHSQAAN